MKNIAMCMLLVLALTGFTFAEANVTNSNVTNETAALNSAAVQARYDNVKLGYEKTLAAMDVVITFLGNKTDTSTLVEIKDNFTVLFDGLNQYVDANDPSGFGKQVAEMHKAAAAFKRETTKATSPGIRMSLRQLVQNRTAQRENDSDMKELKDRLMEKKITMYGLVCRINQERLDNLAEKLSARNISATDLQNVTARMSEKCEKIAQAKADAELKANADALKDDINDARLVVVRKTGEANEMAANKAIAVVGALENRGVNVSQVKEKLAIVKQVTQETKNACANLTTSAGVMNEDAREACKEKINELKDAVGNVGTQIKEVASTARSR